MVQQKGWIAEGKLRGITMIPADTRKLVTDGEVVGQILGTPQDGVRFVYDVVTYSSDKEGIAYYDLRMTGQFKNTLGKLIITDIRNALRNSNNSNSILFRPTPPLYLFLP